MSKKHKATVIVAQREGHNGWFDGGRFWATGLHEGVELSDAEAQSLANRAGVVVLIGGKTVAQSGDVGTVPTTQESLTADEQEALQKHRAERQKLARAAETQAASSPGLEFTKDKKGDAVERATASVGAATVAGDAQAPLQDANILRGEPPPENPAANVKPLDQQPHHGKKR